MGCGASSLRGDDVPSINATARPSYLRAITSSAPTEHYETPLEHEAELQRVQSSQPRRRPSRAAYVDPDDLPMPPKTTHQHYHRSARQEENKVERDAPVGGWNVREMVKMPMRARRMGDGAGGVVVPNNVRQKSFVG